MFGTPMTVNKAYSLVKIRTVDADAHHSSRNEQLEMSDNVAYGVALSHALSHVLSQYEPTLKYPY